MSIEAADRNGFADEAALAWLRGQPEGRIETSIAELARLWGWNRTRVQRRLEKWSADGHIARQISPRGKSLIRLSASSHPPAGQSLARPSPDIGALAPAPPAMDAVVVSEPPPVDARPAVRIMVRPHIVRLFGAAVLAGLALMIAYHGLRMNAWYGRTLGATAEAGVLLAGLSVAADALALVLPAAACALWRDRKP